MSEEQKWPRGRRGHNGGESILVERLRQIGEEGWDATHDDGHDRNDLIEAAICYAAEARHPPRHGEIVLLKCRNSVGRKEINWRDPWPWDKKWDKRHRHSKRRMLVMAGALMAAEIDRLDREEAADAEDKL